MNNQLKNLFNSKICSVAMFMIVCCMVGYTLPLKLYGRWTDIALAFALAGGAILFSLLVWATYILCTKMRVKETTRSQRLILETAGGIMLIVWAYTVISSL